MQKILIALGILALIPNPPLQAALSLKELDPPPSFPAKSEFYSIESIDLHPKEPGILKFRVSSPHAPYEVEGLVQLKKRLHEIEVIERIQRGEAGSGFKKGATDSVKDTGKGFLRLVSHPIESGKGMGKSVGKLGGKMGGVFEKDEAGEKSSWGEKMLGGSEREIAKELGVDVYTDNPHLQGLLIQMAKGRMGGKGVAMVGKFLLPLAGLVAVTVTASGINSAADQFINDKNRGDLYSANMDVLMRLGFDSNHVKQVLNSPYYSPREATYLRFYLEKLKDVPRKDQILKTAASSHSLWEARKILYESQMAADALTAKTKFLRLECVKEGLAVETPDAILFMTPYDYLDRSELGERIVEKVAALKKAGSKSSAEIWNAGKVTSGFSSTAFARGIRTKSWILLLGGESS